MAIDNTPPRLKLIVTIAAITVVTLVSLDFVFKSYYGMMTDEAQREKTRPTREADEQHKAEKAALAQASVDQVMAQFGRGARPETIVPKPSDDLGPMTGWSKLPKPAPVQQPSIGALGTGSEHGDHAVATDGGAVSPEGGALATDAGLPGRDGGAPGVAKDAAAPTAPQPHH